MQLFTTHQQAEFVAALLRLVSPEEVPCGFGGVEIPGGSAETLPLTLTLTLTLTPTLTKLLVEQARGFFTPSAPFSWSSLHEFVTGKHKVRNILGAALAFLLRLL